MGLSTHPITHALTRDAEPPPEDLIHGPGIVVVMGQQLWAVPNHRAACPIQALCDTTQYGNGKPQPRDEHSALIIAGGGWLAVPKEIQVLNLQIAREEKIWFKRCWVRVRCWVGGDNKVGTSRGVTAPGHLLKDTQTTAQAPGSAHQEITAGR